MGDKPAHVSVKINGANVKGTVLSVDVEDHDRLIDRARIVIDDPQQAYAHSLAENQPVVIELGWEDEKALLFTGVIQQPDTASLGGTQQQVTLTALDPSYLMNLRPPPEKAEHEGKLSEIVLGVVKRSVAPAHGIAADEKSFLLSADPKLKLIQPPNVKDWDFIARLAVEHGCRAFVEVDSQGKPQFYFASEDKLLAADPMGVLHFCSGFSEVLSFNYRRIASGAIRTALTALDGAKPGEVVTGKSPGDQPTAVPAPSAETRANLGKTTGATGAYDQAISAAKDQDIKPEAQVPQEFLSGLPSDPELAERLLKRDPTRIVGLFGEGVAVGTIKLRAKGKVTIMGIAPWAEGDWYVARVNHIYTRSVQGSKDRSTYRTKFAVTR
jgi:phage protein D